MNQPATIAPAQTKTRRTKIKTVDINAREWFDRVNGNSYFTARVCINFGLKGERTYLLPFQYGYGDHYKDQCFKKLIEVGEIKAGERTIYWRYFEENKIVFRYSKQEHCKLRDVKSFIE